MRVKLWGDHMTTLGMFSVWDVLIYKIGKIKLFFECICSDSWLFIDTLIFHEKGYFKIKTSLFIYQMRCNVQKRQGLRRKGENMRHPQNWDSPCWAQIIMDIGLRLAFLSCFWQLVIINQSSSNWDNWICCPIHMVS